MRQGPDQSFDVGARGGHIVRGSPKMRPQSVASDQAVVEIDQARLKLVHRAVLPLADGEQVGGAVEFLGRAFHGGKSGFETLGHDLVSGGHEAAFLVGAFLQQKLVDAVGGPQSRSGEHGVHQGREMGGAGREGLALEPNNGQILIGSVGFRGLKIDGEAPGVAGHRLVELQVVEGFGAQLGQAAAVEGEEMDVLDIQMPEIEGKVEVDDAVSGHGRGGEGHAFNLVPFQGRVWGEGADVAQPQSGELGQVLGPVGSGLKGFNLGGEFAGAGFLVGTDALAFGVAGEEGLLGFALAAGQIGVGVEHRFESVGVVEEIGLNPVGKETRILLPLRADVAQAGFGVERLQGIAAVDPGGDGGEHGVQPLGGAVHFTHLEFHLVQRPLHEGVAKAVAGEKFQLFQRQGEHVVGVAGFHAAEARAESGLVKMQHGAAQQVIAQSAFQQGETEGAGGGVEQHVRDQTGHLAGHGIGGVAGQQPVELAECALVGFLGGGIRVGRAAGALPGLLRSGERGGGAGGRPGKRLIQALQPFQGIVVAVESHQGVGGVVVFAVESGEVLEGEIRNVRGIAAVIEAIERIGKQSALHEFLQPGVGTGVDPFHFVVDYALDIECAVVGPLMPPALLSQNRRRQPGKEYRVQVDIHQIVKILQIAAGDGIAGAVWIRERVEKGVE